MSGKPTAPGWKCREHDENSREKSVARAQVNVGTRSAVTRSMRARSRLGPLLLAPLLLLACAKRPTPQTPPGDATMKHVPTKVAPVAPKEASVPTPSAIPANGWSEEERVAHVLSRLAFGARPGDVERIAKSGLEAWIRAQLAPATASSLAKLDALPATKMSVSEALDSYVPKKKASSKGAGGDDMTPAHLARELGAQKVVRAVESDRQLEEVLVDFWFNHFNVDAKKGATQWMTLAYERDAIRANVFGSFRTLLGATAKHPAMLFYLDNWLSSGAASPMKAGKGKVRGLNENYGRELLELHTLGVDGGYDQDDVREVARAFTGWTIEKPRAVGTFLFRPGMHDGGAKNILGTTLTESGTASGIGDGERVLDIVAAHPSTARFIATKLCRRFVSDDPPKELVDEVARVFKETAGDLRATYEAIIFSKHFWADGAKRSKVKDPFELAVSAVRAVGGTIVLDADARQGPGQAAEPLIKAVDVMGEPIYRCAPPTGFKEVATAWVGTGALVARIKFALALAEGRYGKGGHGVVFDPTKLVDPALAHGTDSGALVDAVARALLHRELDVATRTAIVSEIEKLPAGAPLDSPPLDSGDDEVSRRRLAHTLGLVLGSPEFQRQ